MPRVLALVLCAALAFVAVPARADDAAEFMRHFSGEWIGTGQLLLGADNGMEFACDLNGDPSETKLTFGMKGTCRMGSLSAPIHAQLRYNAETNRFYGQFMDGAAGSGVDIVGARASEGFSLKLTRGSTQGRLAARTIGKNELRVVIYFSDPRSDAEVPVVALGFTRRDVITGSVAP